MTGAHPVVPGEFPRDEFDDVPEAGPRQGAHRGERPASRVGARELAAIVVAGALTLGAGAFAYVSAPDGADPAPSSPASPRQAPPATGP
ncbi:hypothetical protein [Kocuria sp.]|uniref:hypothetical protein n=1 Tax=Kocuria sp. TaxID=1871328 RepID=UPI0028121286|nr:hypothetical protein [Kocuria sp.]